MIPLDNNGTERGIRGPAKYLLEAVRAAERGEILLPRQMPPTENHAAVKTG